jgi:hypothetical protein
MKLASTLLAALLFISTPALAQNAKEDTPWKPVEGKIMSRWAKEVDPKNPWPEYPRPTMVREKWQNLNGLWDYALLPDSPPAQSGFRYDGKILVPFPVESALSGVGRRVSPDQTLHYKRTFTVPADWRTNDQRVLLHFGAVDWHATVHVNGQPLGDHQGGYDPFSFDITDQLKANGDNTITVAVKDPTDTGGQPRGKQWADPHGIWYTPTTGIWQTVWMEPVGRASFESLTIVADRQQGQLTVTPVVRAWQERGVPLWELEVFSEGKPVGKAVTLVTAPITIAIPGGARPWSPQAPFLYEIRARSLDRTAVRDEVVSYAAFRDITLAKDESGVNRLFLNGKVTFMFGPLDQGFWPDGLYTPPNEAAMRFDIEAAKKMGCNMLRKHVKVESERFYYLCDKLGIMVWQDMPSPFFGDGKGKPGEENAAQPVLNDAWKTNFESELKELVTDRGSHPSIVMWVPFNEGWGQNDLAWGKAMVDKVKAWDPSRLVNCASGWTDMGNGDVLDIHLYPGPGTATLQANRAVVLGEFGGLGLPLEGHTWAPKNNWGYVSYKNKDELTDAYVDLLGRIPVLIGGGLCAGIYTQTTDVEIECNGWLTYDREVWKIDAGKALAASRALYLPPPVVKIVVPHAGQSIPGASPLDWSYTLESPGEGWTEAGWTKHETWKSGKPGFGTPETPGAIVGTQWNTGEIWLRASVTLGAGVELAHPHLSIHHDEDAEVYFNGVPAVAPGSLRGYTTGYTLVPLTPGAVEILRAGKPVTIAVHCTQTRGGQYIDLGIAEVTRP